MKITKKIQPLTHSLLVILSSSYISIFSVINIWLCFYLFLGDLFLCGV